MGLNLQRQLRICLISYRSNPHCGGQGVYLRNLCEALQALGHRVDVVTGPPDPQLNHQTRVHRPECLDLYNPENPFRVPTLRELASPTNLVEWLGVSSAGFPEPFTFGLRAWQYLSRHGSHYDVIHDNQSLSYGIWALGRKLPLVTTIHHPITVDRRLAVQNASGFTQKVKQLRWHSFITMQRMVAPRLRHLITVSQVSAEDICQDFHIPLDRFHVVPNGIDVDLFRPMPEIGREPDRIITTSSAETPLKGLAYLLHAVAKIHQSQPVHLTVVGMVKQNGPIQRLIRDLDIGSIVEFTGRIDHARFRRLYARSAMAVVPSMYEGFGLPAGEAMACGVPVISTTGGALPEVVGDAGILVPPGDSDALARAITFLRNHPDQARRLGQAGYERVHRLFTWEQAAKKTLAVYRKAIRDYHRC